MAERDSWAVQAAGPTGMLDVEEARVALGALWTPHASNVKAKSGFRPGPSSPGLVTASGSPDGFVHVAPFQLVLQGGRGAVAGPYIATLDAVKDINILATPADPTNPRDDLIVAQQSDTFYGDGTSTFVVRHVVGTPAAVPTDPAVSGSTDYVALARVRVDALAGTITGAKITDLRTAGHAKSLVGGLHVVGLGGILPVATQGERDVLTGVYAGLAVWRTDRGWAEVNVGSGWRVQGVAHCTSVADLAAVTHPYTGQLAVVDTRLYRYDGAAWVRALPASTQVTASAVGLTTTEGTVMTAAFTVKAGDVLVVDSTGYTTANGADRLTTLRLKEDGVTIGTRVVGAPLNNPSGGFAFHRERSGLSAGAHTYTVTGQMSQFTGNLSEGDLTVGLKSS